MVPHPNIPIIKWFNFFSDFRLYAPIAIIYFSQITGSFAIGMSIFSITMLSAALLEIPTGVISDRVGRKKTLQFGAFSSVLAVLLFAIGQHFWILAIGAFFEGLSRSFFSGNNEALLHDSLAENGQESVYDEILGKVNAMFQAALGISGILGGILALWSLSAVLWLSVIPQIICLYLSSIIIEPKINLHKSANVYEHLSQSIQNFKKNKKLRLLSLSSILGYGIGEANYQFQAAFYNTLWPVWAISLAKTLGNIGASISFHFSGKIINKVGSIQTLFYGNIYGRIINIFSTAFPTILSPLLMSTTSLAFGPTVVAKSALMQKEFKSEQRATMGSLNSFAGNIAFAIIAIILGLIADKLSPAHALVILHTILVINIWIYWQLFKDIKNS